MAGDTIRIVERAFTPARVTAAERRQAVERLDTWARQQGGTVDHSRIPSTKPAYETFLLDDKGYLWVRPSTEQPEPADFPTLDVLVPPGGGSK